MNEELLEALAESEHEKWTHMSRYILERLDLVLSSGLATIGRNDLLHLTTTSALKRWRHQIVTPYSKLTDVEKQPARARARKTLKIFQRFVDVPEDAK